MPKRMSPNLKRSLRSEPTSAEEIRALDGLAARVQYGGNPQHKRNAGDFGLTPPAQARQSKTLCDRAQVFRIADALNLLRKGVRKGLVSRSMVNGWPKNVWAVADNGEPVEAILENQATGTYHGYAMGDADPLVDDVLKRW